MSTSISQHWFQALGALFLIPCLDILPRKAAGDGPSTWVPVVYKEVQLLAPGFPGHCNHLGHESSLGREKRKEERKGERKGEMRGRRKKGEVI